jgi:ribosome-associated protein
MIEIDEEELERPPSKSSRKRAAIALQKMGEQLVNLREADLATIPLEESLRDAIEEARRLTSHGGRSRQHQYIGKLMRDADIEAIDRALAALGDAQNTHARLRK